MARIPFPNPDVQVLNDDGTMSRPWFDYLLSRDRLNVVDLRDVSTTAPTNNQVLIYNSTSKLWVPGTN